MIQYFNPLNWLRWIGQFVTAWLLSRPWRSTPAAVPALCMLIIVVTVFVATLSNDADWRGGLLDRQLASAVEREDYDTAEILLVRKLEHSPGDQKIAHRLALTKELQGDFDEAKALMEDLTWNRKFEPAAKWLLANSFANKRWDDLSDKEREEFGRLLAMIYEESPEEPAVLQLYADHLVAKRDFQKALPLLAKLAGDQPMRGLQAAAMARSENNEPAAKHLAERTLRVLEKRLSEEPTNAQISLAVVQTQLFLKQFAEAKRTMEIAISRSKEAKERQQLGFVMGDVIVAWVASIEEVESPTSEDRVNVLQLLQGGVGYAPNNPRVLALVADKVLASLDDDDEQIAALRKSLVQGSSPGISHFIRGTASLMQNDYDSATRSLELAAKELPRSGAILNNLAVSLSMRDDKYLDRALQISEKAIEQTERPAPHFYETRGQILFRLGRHLDAIPDLEKALPVPELAKEAHRSLAECYRELGETELSELHLEAIDTADEDGDSESE